MITHIIYHIPGRKVGCTKNIVWRKKLYLDREGILPSIEILEELHDKTDQEAGDIEWAWADKFGYPRGNHYTIIMKAIVARGKIGGIAYSSSHSPDERSKIAQNGLANVSPKRRSEIARMGGLIGGRRRAETTSRERRSEIGRMGAAAGAIKGNRKAIELKSTGAFKRATCPHCGLESNIMILHRWHFDKCSSK